MYIKNYYLLFFVHFFFPAVAVFLVTPLITPTATVYFMSLTANLPNGGYSEKTSQHNGFDGVKVIIAASPDLMNFGSSSRMAPFLLSIFDLISANLHAMWAVWQSKTGVYPLVIYPGWFKMMT